MPVKIKKTVGRDYVSEPDDILTIKKTLHDFGDYEEPKYGMTPYADERLFDSIKSYQKRNNLQVDGVINPRGETIKSLNNAYEYKSAMVRSPSTWCPKCGTPHGGVFGDICKDCILK